MAMGNWRTAMEKEIDDLKASLLETKQGAVFLAACIVQTLCESDPSFQTRVARNLRRLDGQLQNRAYPDAREMVTILARMVVDPALPLSSDLSGVEHL
jgi:hypothetical protein